MGKKPTKAAKKAEPTTAEHHRQRAREFRAKAQMAEAKASMIDVKNPPKKPIPGGYGY